MTENFSINWRNPGHWDVYDAKSRLFRTRGAPGDFIVRDERKTATKPHLGVGSRFATVDAAMAWICSTLMYEPNDKVSYHAENAGERTERIQMTSDFQSESGGVVSSTAWLGHISIYSETCCEFCNEIIHNHLDCPACGKQYAGSEQYGELEAEKGVTEIECGNCYARFQTEGKWYDGEAVWKRVA